MIHRREIDALMEQTRDRVLHEWETPKTKDGLKFTGFGEAVLKLKAVQDAQVEALEALGVTEADLATEPAQKKPERTPEEVEQWRSLRENNARKRVARTEVKIQRIEADLYAPYAGDTAQVNIPLRGSRLKALRTTINRGVELEGLKRLLREYESQVKKWTSWAPATKEDA